MKKNGEILTKISSRVSPFLLTPNNSIKEVLPHLKKIFMPPLRLQT